MSGVSSGKGVGSRVVAGALVLVLGAWVSGAKTARASSTLTVTANNNLVDIKVKFAALGSSTTTVEAGTLTGQINGGAKFDAYCVDLYHVVNVGGNGSSFLVDPLPIAKLGPQGGNGAGLGYLYDTLNPKIAAEASGTAKNIDGAALQVALWKVEYDNGGSLTKGSFTMQDSSYTQSIQHQVFARATEYLSLYDGTQSGDATWFKALEHPVVDCVAYNQNLIGSCTPPVPTPEPTTLVSSGLGIAGLGAYRWRQKRRDARKG